MAMGLNGFVDMIDTTLDQLGADEGTVYREFFRILHDSGR
jgi:hypothetical protein